MIYRDGAASCPRCGSELGDKLVCTSCGGLWAEEKTVRERWTENARGAPFPTFTARVDHERRLRCIVCGSPMAKVMLEAIELDRCEGHGVWFDRGEIDRLASTAALLAGEAPVEPENSTEFIRWLRREAPPVVDVGPWSYDREELEAMVKARLALIDLDARGGDMEVAKVLVRQAIAVIDEGLRRWPDAHSLGLRRDYLQRKLRALDAASR